MQDRQDWAYERAGRYLGWCEEVENSPFTPLDKVEFAIISAHCPMSNAIDGFLATRGLEDLQALAEGLNWAGVMAPRQKAAYITDTRALLRSEAVPMPDADIRAWRRTYKLPGLGHCKATFAAALIHPLSVNGACLDTHMAQAYGADYGRIIRRLDAYEEVESRMRTEAEEVGLPIFAYQWAVWDWQRLRSRQTGAFDHSFLWRVGRGAAQLPLLMGTE